MTAYLTPEGVVRIFTLALDAAKALGGTMRVEDVTVIHPNWEKKALRALVV
jgi:hypothetical protein